MVEVLFIYGTNMLVGSDDDTEITNAPFDDVTHWVGHLPGKDTDSTKRVTERSTWRKIKPNILRKKLGMETERKD